MSGQQDKMPRLPSWTIRKVGLLISELSFYESTVCKAVRMVLQDLLKKQEDEYGKTDSQTQSQTGNI